MTILFCMCSRTYYWRWNTTNIVQENVLCNLFFRWPNLCCNRLNFFSAPQTFFFQVALKSHRTPPQVKIYGTQKIRSEIKHFLFFGCTTWTSVHQFVLNMKLGDLENCSSWDNFKVWITEDLVQMLPYSPGKEKGRVSTPVHLNHQNTSKQTENMPRLDTPFKLESLWHVHGHVTGRIMSTEFPIMPW